jgi:hypothetical protein
MAKGNKVAAASLAASLASKWHGMAYVRNNMWRKMWHQTMVWRTKYQRNQQWSWR